MHIEDVDFLVVGAGMSGLSFAVAIADEARARGRAVPKTLVVEKDDEPGGYCKTVVRDGFTWDYSGHFFHFKHDDIERWLRARMPGEEVRTVTKKSFIRYGGRDIDFPFQKNIHQLDKDELIECLYDLVFRDDDGGTDKPRSFLSMVRSRFGRGIAEKFLIPYNEKLYACDLDELDEQAMGRFFPHADLRDIVRNMRHPDNTSYNATFTYPRGGAIQYVNAFLRELSPSSLALGERVVTIDMKARIATTTKRQVRYRALVCSAPLPVLLDATGVPYARDAFTFNKVLVFNLGFDKKGPRDVHWMYFPDRALRFYRVGFYDNIMDDDRMSLYVEIGARADETLDIDAERARVLSDLAREGIVVGHRLVAEHHVVMSPAYVHITARSLDETARAKAVLEAASVFSVGRYGGWTYCSIEDNIVETRALAARLGHIA